MKDHNHDSDKKEKRFDSKFELNVQNQYLVKAKFEIPIYIPIPDGKYDVRVKSMEALVQLRRIDAHTSMSKSVRTSKGVISYVPHLRYDPFNSTEVSVSFRLSPDSLQKLVNFELADEDPYTNGPINPLLQQSLLFVNKIVSAYQFYSGNAAIGKIQTWDIGIFDARISPYPTKLPSTARLISQIGYSRPTIHTSGSPTDPEALIQITDKIKMDWSISLETQLLLTARHLYLMGEFSAAVITAQSALEIFLSRELGSHLQYITIRRKRKEERRLLKGAGLAIKIAHGIKQAIGKNLTDIDSNLAKEVKEARDIRNDIVHEGLAVTMIDADKCIKTFSRAIDRLGSEL